jgi:hypothetical protein
VYYLGQELLVQLLAETVQSTGQLIRPIAAVYGVPGFLPWPPIQDAFGVVRGLATAIPAPQTAKL